LVLEQNATVGGKMSQFDTDGFRWDTGPSVITMPHVFEELFVLELAALCASVIFALLTVTTPVGVPLT